MKKLFTFLGTFIISTLAADQAFIAKNTANACEEICEKPCKTKCCPTPPEPICTESYLPSYYDLQCDAGVYLYGDFLYWFANEDNLSPCMTVRGSNTTLVETAPTTATSFAYYTLSLVEVNHLHTKWEPGFRAALGFNFNCDGWDLEANYTWFRNRKHRTFSVPGFGIPAVDIPFRIGQNAITPDQGQLALVDPWINTTLYDQFFPYGTFLFDKVSSQWNLHFNQVDLDLGNKFWIKRSMAMRCYVGVRGAWITTNFINVASSLTNDDFYVHNTFSDNFRNHIWGVGLLGGIQPEWHFCRNFILFSNLDGALLWGKFRVRKQEDYASFGTFGSQSINYHNHSFSNFLKLQAVMDLTLGLRWEKTWCYRVRTYLDFGWENHIWFDINNRYKLAGSSESFFSQSPRVVSVNPNTVKVQSYEEEQGNLMLGGAFVRFRIDF
ncbi:MAG TPA: Lpg1974 family pore-forming outer membrane protein [Chlamydiales bacterium]|nr:Lpg1974 family pore-forming outer membrane protein [Chlamydiales bacterium]